VPLLLQCLLIHDDHCIPDADEYTVVPCVMDVMNVML
jgi:hypothetical protein